MNYGYICDYAFIRKECLPFITFVNMRVFSASDLSFYQVLIENIII